MNRCQFEHTRRVWADLTAHPGTEIRDICLRTGIHTSGVQQAINELEWAGYIDRDPRQSRARRVVVPFITEFRIVAPASESQLAAEGDP